MFILYRGERVGGELRAADDALDARFFRPDELPEIAFASTRHAPIGSPEISKPPSSSVTAVGGSPKATR